ncbi:MAG TPA: hypothetical protein VGD46_13475 [Rhizobacter sp.]
MLNPAVLSYLPRLPVTLKAKQERFLQLVQRLPFDEQVEYVRAQLQDIGANVSALRSGEPAPGLRHLQEVGHILETHSHVPVAPDTFLLDRYFLDRRSEAYPEVVKEFVRMNSGQYNEVVLTGAIGTAKTTLAIWTCAYQLYRLSCILHPQNYFGLQASDEILFIFQSLNEKLAKALNFERFRHLLLGCQYFKDHFPFDTGVESELRFPKRIIVKPVTGADTAAIGQNVFGGILDEVNFMSNVEDSKKNPDGGGYDQALALYNTISRRRKSRFMRKGVVPGIFCIVSSKRYPGQFTDQKAEEAKTDHGIYIYDKRTWDVLPSERFSGKWFKVFVGDLTRKPRILDADEKFNPEDVAAGLIVDVPEDYRTEFQSDMMNALRDIAGVSTLARHPYIMNNEAVALCFGRRTSVLSTHTCDFLNTKLAIHPKRFRDTEYPRFVHIDLGITGDAAGVACGYVSGFDEIQINENVIERLPRIEYDFTLRVTPPRGDEIQFHKIRDLIYKLRDLGLPIKWVTLDSFQSRDMIQTLRTKGFITGLVSVDTDNTPYDTLKTALYQSRVWVPSHEHAEKELVSLERDTKKNKIDHPPNGSKDVADAMAGVAYGLTMRRETWVQHGISMFEIPDSVRQMAERNDNRLRAADEEGRRVAVRH